MSSLKQGTKGAIIVHLVCVLRVDGIEHHRVCSFLNDSKREETQRAGDIEVILEHGKGPRLAHLLSNSNRNCKEMGFGWLRADLG